MAQESRKNGWSWWHLVLLVQFVLCLGVPFYNKLEPSFIGLPFFYWFQLALVIIGAALTAIVYFATER
jgi:Protein of unknown function (DUF3311)